MSWTGGGPGRKVADCHRVRRSIVDVDICHGQNLEASHDCSQEIVDG